ncbi:DUF4124 domain-containing protein [Marinobacter pelagius]|uniref:DUF4124 domain-containing protein n=1 Tax=Marinobacter sp. C7 TaxID=2951363 RepID=UPI00333968B5|nr:DUF4124 domain-containing protein [Marinobacter sp. C7]
MNRTRFLTALLIAFPGMVLAEVYRCENNGSVTFADQPCGDDARPIELKDNRIGGRFNQNLPEPAKADSRRQDQEAEQPEAASTCRFINSTDLRRYLIREQVVRGTTRDHVRRAFGNPPEVHTSPKEVWIYQTRYYGALYELTYVYFRDGCVERVEYRKP